MTLKDLEKESERVMHQASKQRVVEPEPKKAPRVKTQIDTPREEVVKPRLSSRPMKRGPYKKRASMEPKPANQPLADPTLKISLPTTQFDSSKNRKQTNNYYENYGNCGQFKIDEMQPFQHHQEDPHSNFFSNSLMLQSP